MNHGKFVDGVELPARLHVGGENGYVLTIEMASESGDGLTVQDNGAKEPTTITEAMHQVFGTGNPAGQVFTPACGGQLPVRLHVGGETGYVLTIEMASGSGDGLTVQDTRTKEPTTIAEAKRQVIAEGDPAEQVFTPAWISGAYTYVNHPAEEQHGQYLAKKELVAVLTQQFKDLTKRRYLVLSLLSSPVQLNLHDLPGLVPDGLAVELRAAVRERYDSLMGEFGREVNQEKDILSRMMVYTDSVIELSLLQLVNKVADICPSELVSSYVRKVQNHLRRLEATLAVAIMKTDSALKQALADLDNLKDVLPSELLEQSSLPVTRIPHDVLVDGTLKGILAFGKQLITRLAELDAGKVAQLLDFVTDDQEEWMFLRTVSSMWHKDEAFRKFVQYGGINAIVSSNVSAAKLGQLLAKDKRSADAKKKARKAKTAKKPASRGAPKK